MDNMCENNYPYLPWLGIGRVDQQDKSHQWSTRSAHNPGRQWRFFFGRFWQVGTKGRTDGKCEYSGHYRSGMIEVDHVDQYKYMKYGISTRKVGALTDIFGHTLSPVTNDHYSHLKLINHCVNSIDPLGRPIITDGSDHYYFHTCHPSVCPSQFWNFLKNETIFKWEYWLLLDWQDCGSDQGDHWWHLSCIHFTCACHTISCVSRITVTSKCPWNVCTGCICITVVSRKWTLVDI